MNALHTDILPAAHQWEAAMPAPPAGRTLSPASGGQPRRQQMKPIEPLLKSFTHPEIGTLRAVRIGRRAWLSLDDLGRIIGISQVAITDRYAHNGDWQVTLDTGETLVTDLAVTLLLRHKDDPLLIWIRDVIKIDLFSDFNEADHPVECLDEDPALRVSASAIRLHRIFGMNVKYPAWVKQMSRHMDNNFSLYVEPKDNDCTCDRNGCYCDYDVSLELALWIALYDPSFGGRIARIVILEALADEHDQQSLDAALDLCIGLLPDDRNQIDAWRFHEFLGVKRPFARWIAKPMKDFWMKPGRDYLTAAGGTGDSKACSNATGSAVISISTQMAKYIAMLDPSRRGCQMGRHILAHGESPSPEHQPPCR